MFDIENRAEAPFEGAFRLRIWSSDDDGVTWNHMTYKAARTTVKAGETAQLSIPVAGTASNPLKEGMVYRVSLVNPIPNSTDSLHYVEGVDEMAYLVVKPSSLQVTGYEDGVLKLKGQWDPVLFLADSLAGKSTYAEATAYDLTEVVGIDHIDVSTPNPNALFYVADGAEVEGRNVVSGGVCGKLALSPGHDFVPLAPFQAVEASLTLEAKAAQWGLVTVPFAADVPDGVAARRIDGHSESGIAGKTTDLDNLSQGMTYMMMTSRNGKFYISAENVGVASSPAENADAAVVGTFRNTEIPEGGMIPNDAENQSFVKTSGSVEAMRGYFLASDVERNFSASTNTTTDPAYLLLAQNINTAYTILHRYRDIVSEEAFNEYLAAINEAESAFTHRSGTQFNSSAEIKSYAAHLLELGDEYLRKIVKVGNVELDFSSSMINPSFEMKSTNGWTLTKPSNPNITASTAARVYANSSLNYFTAGADGNYILNNTYIYTKADGQRDTLSVGISQEVTGLLPGYYKITALLGSDVGNTITLFAGDKKTEVVAHKFGKHYFTEAVVDNVLVEAGDDGTASLTIGVEPGNWFKADNFRIFYLGPKAQDDPTDIISVNAGSPVRQTAKGMYTLQGIRVQSITTPGIYIVDGKKVVVK